MVYMASQGVYEVSQDVYDRYNRWVDTRPERVEAEGYPGAPVYARKALVVSVCRGEGRDDRELEEVLRVKGF